MQQHGRTLIRRRNMGIEEHQPVRLQFQRSFQRRNPDMFHTKSGRGITDAKTRKQVTDQRFRAGNIAATLQL